MSFILSSTFTLTGFFFYSPGPIVVHEQHEVHDALHLRASDRDRASDFGPFSGIWLEGTLPSHLPDAAGDSQHLAIRSLAFWNILARFPLHRHRLLQVISHSAAFVEMYKII